MLLLASQIMDKILGIDNEPFEFIILTVDR